VYWLITFTTYGTHLHDPPALARWEQRQLSADIYLLNEQRRPIVLAAIRRVCERSSWDLIAAHVRTNHVHILLDGPDARSASLASAIKSDASRRLSLELGEPHMRRWTRSSSILRVRDFDRILKYVIDGQGPPMARYQRPAGPPHLPPATL